MTLDACCEHEGKPMSPPNHMFPRPPALPEIETVSAKVHEAWIASKLAAGVTTRKLETGEELMVPYDQLSDAAKELDRGTVRAVYAAIEAAAR